MEERLLGLGGTWDAVNRINIYTVHPISGLVEEIVLPKLVASEGARHPLVSVTSTDCGYRIRDGYAGGSAGTAR